MQTAGLREQLERNICLVRSFRQNQLQRYLSFIVDGRENLNMINFQGSSFEVSHNLSFLFFPVIWDWHTKQFLLSFCVVTSQMSLTSNNSFSISSFMVKECISTCSQKAGEMLETSSSSSLLISRERWKSLRFVERLSLNSNHMCVARQKIVRRHRGAWIFLCRQHVDCYCSQ